MLNRKDFQFHGVTEEENQRLGDSAYKGYIESKKRESYHGDIHGQGGEFMSSKPKFDIGSGLWHQSTTEVEAYIKLLEDRIIALGSENEELQDELTAVKRNRELTMKWARGEMEN